MEVAGKTGTTDDDYDRWFVGYTPYYTAAVWTGYDRASRIQSITNPACNLWQQVMEKASQGQESISFTESMDGEPVTFCRKCGTVATGRTPSTDSAWFLPGDEPTGSCTHKGKKK
jgi:penicillin-binding protein 1A